MRPDENWELPRLSPIDAPTKIVEVHLPGGETAFTDAQAAAQANRDAAKLAMWPRLVATIDTCHDEMCRQTFPGARRKDLNYAIDKARELLAEARKLQ